MKTFVAILLLAGIVGCTTAKPMPKPTKVIIEPAGIVTKY